MDYGYVRVSSKTQNEDRQFIALCEFGIHSNKIYTDWQSGKDFHRPAYKKLIKKLKKGDLLVIASIDRLGRNYEEIIEQWRLITKDLRCDILVLDMPLLDTRSKDKDLTGIFISDLVLQILSYVAQIERENIKKRQAEGIAAAKIKGKHLGRPKKEIPSEFFEIYRMCKEESLTVVRAAKLLNISRSTFIKWTSEIR